MHVDVFGRGLLLNCVRLHLKGQDFGKCCRDVTKATHITFALHGTFALDKLIAAYETGIKYEQLLLSTHVCSTVWEAAIGEEPACEKEPHNAQDSHAVTVT